MKPLIQTQNTLLGVADFESKIRETCGIFDVEPKSDSVFGGVEKQTLGTLDAAIVSVHSAQITRDEKAIRQDPGEHFFLLIQDSGYSKIQQSNNTVSLYPGDMLLVDSVKPSVFYYGQHPSCQISLHIPRSEAMHKFAGLNFAGIKISHDEPLCIAMHAVLSKMLEPNGTDLHRLSDIFMDLICAYLHGSDINCHTAHTDELLSKALNMIDMNSLNASFSPRDIATQLNVSERTLQRHFQVIGEAPGHRILQTRLDYAHKQLRLRHQSGLRESITDIALRSGFNDLSYFYREFRKKYGMAPGSIIQ